MNEWNSTGEKCHGKESHPLRKLVDCIWLIKTMSFYSKSYILRAQVNISHILLSS